MSRDLASSVITSLTWKESSPMAAFDQRTSLVHDRFGIDGRCEFWGYHDPADRWNGWATPRFVREVAELIVDWVNQGDPEMAWWEGEFLCCRGGDGEYVERIESDELGLYRFDGWIWLEAEA